MKALKITLQSLGIFIFFACNNSSNIVTKDVIAKSAATIADSISVKLEPVSNLAAIPVEMNEPLSDGNFFVTDVAGKIWILDKDSMIAKPFFDRYGKLYTPSEGASIGRVYSVAFHPQYSVNHTFYVCYTAPSHKFKTSGRLVVSQFTTDKKNLEKCDLKSEKKILQLDGSNIGFNGAEMRFGPDGYLYISIGDDKSNDSLYKFEAQDLGSLHGKILRIDVDKLPYTIPADNPFVGVKNAKPEIWAYGFRKFWRYSFDRVSHRIFGGDVGEESEEEIDIIQKGGNYGWPKRQGDSSFEKNEAQDTGYISPIYTYSHMKGICVIGGDFYYGKDLPQLTKKYVFADWSSGLFALSQNQNNKWNCVPIKIVNKPSKPFFICGCFIDKANQLFVMGFLAGQNDETGVIYKVTNG